MLALTLNAWWSSYPFSILQQVLSTCGLCWKERNNSEDSLTVSFYTVAWNYQDTEVFATQCAFFCPQCVVVWDDRHHTINEKPQQKSGWWCARNSVIVLEADLGALATCKAPQFLLLQHMLLSVIYDFTKAQCLGSDFPCWMYAFRLNCFLLFIFHPPNTFLI